MPETKTVKSSDPDAAEKAAQTVLAGGIIIYPTETLYGIGGLALNRHVAQRVSDIKKRPPDKPLPVLVRDEKMLRRYFIITEKQKEAYKKILPLPVTLVLRLREKGIFPPQVSADGLTAVRISGGDFVRRIFDLLDEPLISSSANPSGEPNLRTGAAAAEIFGGRVELIVDSGNLRPSEGSAIVSLADNTPKILRHGDLKPEQMSEFVKWLS